LLCISDSAQYIEAFLQGNSSPGTFLYSFPYHAMCTVSNAMTKL